MKTIVFNLVLQEPLLATQANSAEPNSSISHDYIPGSMIRGALIGRYVKQQNVSDLANHITGYDLFLSGKVRFLNGYLFNQKRLLPKPLSWFVEKGLEKEEVGTIYDFAVATTNKLERPKSPRGGFVSYGNEQQVWLDSPQKQVQVHNASTDPGRKASGISQVYRYDALAAEQTFQAAIVADDVDLAPLLTLLAQEYFVIGRSSTAGYGLVKIEAVQEQTDWQEYEAGKAHDDFHFITCLSDLILRDVNGQISASLGQILNVTNMVAFQKVHLVGGFNNKWGLTLPQAMAIRSGSVFCIPKGAISEQRLQDYVDKGIGERLIEGYGRIALNLNTDKTKQRTPTPKVTLEMPRPLSTTSRNLVQSMANRQLRQRLEAQLKVVIRENKAFKHLPSATQLSRVRLAARQALAKKDLAHITHHLDGIKGARSSWEKARLGGKPLLDWIKQQCQSDQAQFISLFHLSGKLPAIAGIAGQANASLETEFRARLIDGVLQQAVLQQQDNGQNGRQGEKHE